MLIVMQDVNCSLWSSLLRWIESMRDSGKDGLMTLHMYLLTLTVIPKNVICRLRDNDSRLLSLELTAVRV